MKSSYVMDIVQEDCRNALKRPEVLGALKGETVLITGGTGFMGTWLAEMIATLNDHFGFGTKLFLLSGRANNLSARAPHIAVRPDVTLIERDIRGLMEIPQEVSWIIHAAGNPDNRVYASEPLRGIEVITRGTAAVLDCATRLPNLKKMLNVSSASIYGNQPDNLEKISEGFFGNLDCASVMSSYAEAKRFAETLCTVYRSQHRLPLVCARPFAFIGPYQMLDRPWAVNNFMRDALLGGAIRILGDGQTVRSYMYPSDMAFWLLRILTDGVPGQNYNVGSPEGVTLLALAEKIADLFPDKPRIASHLLPPGKAQRSRLVPDISLAQNSLGLEITVDLDTAIKRTILWNQAQQKLTKAGESKR
ncbi:MAG: NAD-dependent epimerase/dehydratase family protein [Candidatus Omnitrophica bacterium]|nr:NAD-dependent epimerase/dehydratase family protein [Candidatus Omnitrophota bacterium]